MSIDVQAPPEAATASTITEGAYQLDTMDRDTNIGRLVHRVRHALVTNIDSALASLDLTAAQWTVVIYLAEDLATTPAELAPAALRSGRDDAADRSAREEEHRQARAQ